MNTTTPAPSPVFDTVEKVQRQGELGRHPHKVAELFVCIGGSAIDTVNSFNSTVSPGDVYVLTRDVIHAQTYMGSFRCCIFKFYMQRLMERAADAHLTEKPGFQELFINDVRERKKGVPVPNLCIDAGTVRYVEQIADMMKDESDPDILDILFLSLVALLSTRCNRKRSTEAQPIPRDIAEVAFYIEQNFDKPLTLENLSLQCHYSQRHFARLMREHYGMSPMAYLDAVRMKNACDLLLRTTHSVVQIARLCGFEDNNLFSRHFRAAMGVSPTVYRQENRNLMRVPTLTDVDIINDGE